MPYIKEIMALQFLLEEVAIAAGMTVTELSQETIADFATNSTFQILLSHNQPELLFNTFFLVSC